MNVCNHLYTDSVSCICESSETENNIYKKMKMKLLYKNAKVLGVENFRKVMRKRLFMETVI
jgi:hypothetical protein